MGTLGFTWVIHYFFLIFAQKHKLWYSLDPPRQGVSTIFVLSRNMKNFRIFYLKTFSFLVVRFSIYLNRRVLVMTEEQRHYDSLFVCLCSGFTAQSTQRGHVERGQFT